ncbi:MAG: hypothetical protein VST65_08255, partial [Nitrospirota bacterium]|nr:hypothetical protein [Nitrospirota bacterium]
MPDSNPMVFRNYGGNYQLRIEDAGDLALVLDLDPARWAATSVQIDTLQCDPAFLGYLNADGSGTIRPEHLRAALRWVFHMIAERERITTPSDVLRLADLDTSHEEGQKLREAAGHILDQLQAENADEITLEQVHTFRNIYVLAPPNGDGVLPPEHISDPAAARLASDVLAHVGGTPDLSGKDGIEECHLTRFLDRVREFLAWKERAQGDRASQVLPWGDATPAAATLVSQLDAKIEQHFWQCDLVKLDYRTADQYRLTETDLANLAHSDGTILESRLTKAPLQIPTAEPLLDLQGTINPYYRDEVDRLRSEILTRAQPDGHGRLSRTAWRQLKAIFEPYWAWQAEKPSDDVRDVGKATSVADLGEATLKEYLRGSALETLRGLILEDLAVKDEVEQVNNLEKLILYSRWLLELANNFVNFSALYDPGRRALFEMGDLIIDGRRLTFTMKVRDRAEHMRIAATSRLFLVYVDVTGQGDGEENFLISAAVTAGGRGGIDVGKRGVFYDLRGREWNARVVGILQNPISLWEAIKAPFVRVRDLVARKAEAFATTKVQALETAATEVTTKMEKGEAFRESAEATPGPPAGVAPASTSGMRDLLLGGGIAFAAIGSSLTYLLRTVTQINLLKASLSLVGVMAVVAVFSALVGWSRLRKRDMSAMLEACGWAVNFRMYMTHRLDRLFTRAPGIPKDARTERRDMINVLLRPTRHRASRWPRIGLVLLLIVVIIVAVMSAGWW